MNRIGKWVLMLLLFAPAAWALDETKDKPKPAKPATPAEEYRALTQEFDKARGEVFKALREAKKEEDREKVMNKYRALAPSFAGRFLKLAQDHPKDAAAVDALVWIVSNAEAAPEAGKAVAALVQDHLQSEKIGSLVQRLEYSRFPPAEKLLRAVLEKSTNQEMQGRASFILALNLKNKSEEIKQIRQADPKMAKQLEQFYGKVHLKEYASKDPDKLLKEAEGFFERVLEQYPDLKHFNRTQGEAAKGELFEIRNLAIGKVAPDIEGEDIDSKKFKLSDYRGKVVVLDFWGNW